MSYYVYSPFMQGIVVQCSGEDIKTSNDVQIVIGEYISSDFNAWGVLNEHGIGSVVSGSYPSGNEIVSICSRNESYGFMLQSSESGEVWSGWDLITVAYKFSDNTEYKYRGRLAIYPNFGYYASTIIDENLNSLLASRVGENATITISEAIASDTIEIVIGKNVIDETKTIYGFHSESGTGELVSGEFLLGDAVKALWAGDDGQRGMYFLQETQQLPAWGFAFAVTAEWIFEDNTTYLFPSDLRWAHSTDAAYYTSTVIDETLNSMLDSRVGQTAKIKITESVSTKDIFKLNKFGRKNEVD
ncbi:hypothetical protein [Vibrio parahaemolyticus]|uniref:hypothetical protein n=1 Tax=Vibrio parahaemolyticus TaxID=670 RepID=UPI000407D07B|nr:hypothetical protein [Vibrio parahaemolyticus]